MAGFPYEGWTGTGRYLDRVQLHLDGKIKDSGSIGFTDELVYHFRSPFPPFGKNLKPIQDPEEACRRAKALVGSPSGYKFTAKLRTFDYPMKPLKPTWSTGRKFYEVGGTSPETKRTYAMCMWADTGAVFMYDMSPRPEIDKQTLRHP